MSIRDKIFVSLIFSAVMPLALIAVTVLPFHANNLMDREVALMSAASQNRALRVAAVLQGSNLETLQQIADQYPALGQSPQVLVFSRDDAGHFSLVTKPRYEATAASPYEDMQPLLTEAFKDSDAHHATLPDQRGVSVVMVARRAPGTQDAVIVTEDRSEILQPDAILRDYFLVLSFIAIALAALIALMLTRTVTGPLLTLSRTVATFETDKPLRIEVEGNDEVSRLARRFRDLWERIKDYNKDLEQDVWKRTAEVSEAKRAVEEANAVLAARLAEIEKLNALMVGREMTMVEMKRELAKYTEDNEKK